MEYKRSIVELTVIEVPGQYQVCKFAGGEGSIHNPGLPELHYPDCKCEEKYYVRPGS